MLRVEHQVIPLVRPLLPTREGQRASAGEILRRPEALPGFLFAFARGLDPLPPVFLTLVDGHVDDG